MADFTVRLSDGSAWKVSASSREEAARLARLEDSRRVEAGGQDPVIADLTAGLARAGVQLPPEEAGPLPMAAPGPRPGAMSPEQLEALRTLPPAPTQPLLAGSPRQPQSAPGAYPNAPVPTGGMAAATGAELRAGGGGPPVLGQFIPPRAQSMLRPVLETGAALGTLAATGGLSAPITTAAQLGRVALAGGGGAALGSLASDVLGIAPSESPGEAYRRAGETAAFEAMATPVGEIGAAGLRLGARQVAKLNTQLASLAEQYGIRLGIEDLSMRGYLQRARNVLGRFPWQADPFQEATQRKGRDIAQAVQAQFDSIAPLAQDPFRVSQRTLRESRAAWEEYRAGADELYGKWRANAKTSGATFSPNITRTRAQELLDESAEKAAEIGGAKARLQPDPLTRLATRITNLADGQTITAYDGLKKDLQGISAKLKDPHQRGRISSLLEGLELDLRSTVDNAATARELAEADKFFREGKAIFETATARRFGRYQKGIFDVGAIPTATSLDPGNMVRKVFETGSRRAIAEYKQLVGEQTFRQASRLHLQDKFNAALQIVDSGKDAGKVRLNMDKLSRELGLFNPGSERRAALNTMLDGTGVRATDLENLARLAELAAQSGPIDVSTFVQRRAVMGGFRGAVGSFIPGADYPQTGVGIGKEALKTLTVLIEGRRLGRWLTDPRAVKNLTAALNPRLQQSARTAAFIRFGRLIEQEESQRGDQYGVPQAGLAGGVAGAATTVPSLLWTPARGALGAGQALTGAGLSRAAGAPFRLSSEELSALRQGR